MSPSLAIMFAAPSCAACAIVPGASDAGMPEAGTATVGDQCSTIVNEFCSQAISRCGLTGFTLGDCINSDMAQCCTGSVCSRASTLTASAIGACKAAIDVEDCNGITNSQLPAECQAVLQKS